MKKWSLGLFWFYSGWFFADQLVDVWGRAGWWTYLLAWCFFLLGTVLCLSSLFWTTALENRQALNKTASQEKSYFSQKPKYAVLFFLPVIFTFHLRVCIIERLLVSGDSMRPALPNARPLWVEKLSTGLQLPRLAFPFGAILPLKAFPSGFTSFQRGEPVVFYYPESANKKSILIKRVIAFPGESYAIHSGNVYIDGARLQEPYLPEHVRSRGRPEVEPRATLYLPPELKALGPIASYAARFGIPGRGVVPQKTVLVLGDQRAHSRDSRSFGFVPISYITGRPLRSFGRAYKADLVEPVE